MKEDPKVTVYVVDDEPNIAATLTAILSQSGFHAIGFTDSNNALASAQFQAPELLITDVFLPGMNGIELAIRFKSEFPGCKILLISGHGATSDLLESAAKQEHRFDCLAKSIHPAYILAAIQNVITDGVAEAWAN